MSKQIALFNSRDKMPGVESIDSPREVRSRICYASEFRAIKDLGNRFGSGCVGRAEYAELDWTM